MSTTHSSMPARRFTVRDDSLTHQIKLSYLYPGQAVSCNCRATTGEHSKAGKLYYDKINPDAPVRSFAEAKALYNEPENHWAPFSEEDMIK